MYPVEFPKHSTLMCVSVSVNGAYNSEMVIFPVEEQPLPSVTVTV